MIRAKKSFFLFFILFISFFTTNNLFAEENPVKIGSHFTLTDQDGKEFDTRQIKQKHFLVFFGYTTCPEICPTALNNIKVAFETETKLQDKFQPLFITLNPDRDNIELLKAHYDAFDKKIIMLRGEPDKIKELAKQYRIYYGTNATTGEIDHSSIIYIMDKNGDYIDHVMGNDLETLKKKLLSIS